MHLFDLMTRNMRTMIANFIGLGSVSLISSQNILRFVVLFWIGGFCWSTITDWFLINSYNNVRLTDSFIIRFYTNTACECIRRLHAQTTGAMEGGVERSLDEGYGCTQDLESVAFLRGACPQNLGFLMLPFPPDPDRMAVSLSYIVARYDRPVCCINAPIPISD